MGKTKKEKRPPEPVPCYATAARYDGGAVKIEIVLAQPDGAVKLADQMVDAVVSKNRKH